VEILDSKAALASPYKSGLCEVVVAADSVNLERFSSDDQMAAFHSKPNGTERHGAKGSLQQINLPRTEGLVSFGEGLFGWVRRSDLAESVGHCPW